MKTFTAKTPAENRPFAIGFLHRLAAGETIVTANVAVIVHRGTDANPGAIVSGDAAEISGTDVLQRIHGGLPGVDYVLVVTITTSLGNTRDGFALLPVRTIVYE